MSKRQKNVDRALAWTLDMTVRHLLSHRMDDNDLTLAIELLKAVRDEPDNIPALFKRWDLKPDKARQAHADLAIRARRLDKVPSDAR